MKLQLTIMRASLRSKESELDSEQRGSRAMGEELGRLRHLIGTFIEGRAEREPPAGAARSLAEAEGFPPAWFAGEARDRETDVFALSDEVDELFAQCQHEGQRQAKFLHDMDALVRSVRPEEFALAPAPSTPYDAVQQPPPPSPEGGAARRGKRAGALPLGVSEERGGAV